ncbi:MAG: hypothetical protein IPI67_30180 [Myxococcales bacterium]|nr:hypothetical protein [Myxococcales bacterium]
MTALHVVLAVADPRSGVTPLAALVPLHRNLPRWVWRAVHASAFGTFVLGFAHGLAAGTDTQSVIVRGMYIGTAVVLAGVSVFRILGPWLGTRASAGAGASAGE